MTDTVLRVDAFEVLGEPVRRRVLELLAGGERSSGALTEAVRAEFGITQPAVSQHLKVLRDNGFATVRADGTRRLYAVDPAGLAVVGQWLAQFTPESFLNQRLDALATELARGRHTPRTPRPQLGDQGLLGADPRSTDPRKPSIGATVEKKESA